MPNVALERRPRSTATRAPQARLRPSFRSAGWATMHAWRITPSHADGACQVRETESAREARGASHLRRCVASAPMRAPRVQANYRRLGARTRACRLTNRHEAKRLARHGGRAAQTSIGEALHANKGRCRLQRAAPPVSATRDRALAQMTARDQRMQIRHSVIGGSCLVFTRCGTPNVRAHRRGEQREARPSAARC